MALNLPISNKGLLIICVPIIIIVAFFVLTQPAAEPATPQTIPQTTPSQTPPASGPEVIQKVPQQTNTEEDRRVLRIVATDVDYEELKGLVSDVEGFGIVARYPLKAADVATGSTYLSDKLPEYDKYLPYLQKLALTGTTELVRFERPWETNATSFYSVLDEQQGKSLQLFLFLQLQLTSEVAI